MEGVMMNDMEGGKKEVVCAQLSCGDPQVYSSPTKMLEVVKSP